MNRLITHFKRIPSAARPFFMVLVLLTYSACKPPGLKVDRDRDGEQNLTLLRNTKAVVGIAFGDTDRGFSPPRVVVLRFPWGQNLIPAHKQHSIESHGHYSEFSVISSASGEPQPTIWKKTGQSAVHAVFEGTQADVVDSTQDNQSSVKFFQTLRLHPDGRVEISNRVVNDSARPLTLHYRARTSLPSRGTFYAWSASPVPSGPIVEQQGSGNPLYRMEEGTFFLPAFSKLPRAMPAIKQELKLRGRELTTAAIYRDAAWLIASRAESAEADDEALMVKIQRYPAGDKSSDHLTLSHIGAAVTLNPGDRASHTSIWHLLEYAQPNTLAAESSFLGRRIVY